MRKASRFFCMVLMIALLLTAVAAIYFPEDASAYTISKMEGVIGWDGDKDSPIPRMNGSMYIRDGRNLDLWFSIYNNPTTQKWYNEEGYLPCLVTEFERDNCTVKIKHFGDKVTLGGNNFVIAYSRVSVYNHGSYAVTLAPGQNSNYTALTNNSTTVQPGQTVNHDFAIAADRFGGTYAWPSSSSIAAAGSWDTHYTNMKNFWNGKLGNIVNITQLPDTSLINAYKAGYCYTRIINDGYDIHVGENGYDIVFDHDSIGIITNLINLGDLGDAKNFIDRIQSALQYSDAKWKFSWPYALYLLKTGDTAYVNENFDVIKSNTHTIESERTGPDGIMKMTNDLDSDGYWTMDNCSALFGLSTYKYICDRLGKTSESAWASNLYDSLLTSVNNKLDQTRSAYGLNYIPASIVQPNTANRCSEPRDANWASQMLFGRWNWDGYLFGANQSGTLLDAVDATYDYGFGRLIGNLPAHDFGGYPHGFYSSAYNAGYGSGGLRGNAYRTEGIYAYKFMINDAMTSPYGWWEGIWYPDTTVPWQGTHPGDGGGSCPHMWGQATATKVLIDSLIAEKSDGTVLVGNGIPNEWLTSGKVTELSNYPIKDNGRMGVKIEGLANNQVRVILSGTQARNNVVVRIPAFINNIIATTAGTIDNEEGTVTIPAATTSVTVTYGSNPQYGKDMGGTQNPPPAQLQYRIKNVWTGSYMHLENKNGTVQYGDLNTGWESMKWIVEDVGDGSGTKRIKNVWTGDYLTIENVTGYVQYAKLNTNWWSMMWILEDIGEGKTRIKSRWPEHSEYMHTENKTGYVQSGSILSGWLSAQWVLEPIN